MLSSKGLTLNCTEWCVMAVKYLPSIGEYLQFSVTTPTDDLELRVVDFQLPVRSLTGNTHRPRRASTSMREQATCTGSFPVVDGISCVSGRLLRKPTATLRHGSFRVSTHLLFCAEVATTAHSWSRRPPGTIASLTEPDGEGLAASPIHLPHSVKDEEGGSTALNRRRSPRVEPPPPQLQLEEGEETPPVAADTTPPTVDAMPPPEDDVPPPTHPIRQSSAPKIESVSWARTANVEPTLPTTVPPKLGSAGATQSSKRRITYAVDEVSHHALDRLGVNADILKKEKGMKKLGICDVDIVRSEELRRYTGVSQLEPTSKVEFMFGFNDEQLHRDKAIKRLGTSEQEIMDDYSRRISRLGINSSPVPL